MRTLEDVWWALRRMGVEASEVPISNPAYNYLIGQAEKVVDAEEEEEDEEEDNE